MKNNFLKTVAVIATAVALLATSMTSFAATATTVTTYNETTSKPHVVSTVEGVDAGVMVTYLATKEGTVATKEDIVYVGQETSDGSTAIKFEYDAQNSTSAQIIYGASLSDVATALNNDAGKSVSIAGVSITKDDGVASVVVKDGEGNAINEPYTLGNGETGSVAVTPNSGYELSSVTVNGVAQEITANTFAVTANDAVVIATVKVVSDVELDAATTYFVDEEAEDGTPLKTVGLVCQINGTRTGYTYGVYAEKDGAAFELDATLETTNGFYPATVNGEYYAVQLASEADLTGVTLYPYYNNGTENIICR